MPATEDIISLVSHVARYAIRWQVLALPAPGFVLTLHSILSMNEESQHVWGISKGLQIWRPANRSGWLQTFLSCMRQFIMLMTFPLAKVFSVSPECMYSS